MSLDDAWWIDHGYELVMGIPCVILTGLLICFIIN